MKPFFAMLGGITIAACLMAGIAVQLGWWLIELIQYLGGSMIPSQRMWTIINTETAKEQYVAYRLENLGCEVYLPLMVRFRALSKHVSTNRRTMYELPVLPRQLFAVLPFDLELLDIKHVKGAERGLGGVSLVPDYQMEVFREFVTTERLDAIEAHAKQSRQKPPKRKFQKMTPELLEQWSLRQSNNISKPLD